MTTNYSKMFEDVSKKAGDLLEKAGPFIDKLAEEIKKLFQSLNTEAHPNLICVDTEFLTKDFLIETAKKYKVPQATAVAAIIEKGDKNCFIKIAYLVERDLLPEADNKYVNIKCEGVSREVESLFENNKCIILK